MTIPSSPSQWDTECEINERQLLQCVVEVARAVFQAEAASVFLAEEDTGDLVFEAVSGRGEEHLIGTRFPAGTGIAGWVVSCGQPVLTDDLGSSEQFAADAAADTGYVPSTLAAAPLFRAGVCIGVLEVLDRRAASMTELEALDLLGLLATQAAVGLELLQRLRRTTRGRNAATRIDEEDGSTEIMSRISARLPNLNSQESRMMSQVLRLADDLAETAAQRAGR